MLMPLLGDKTYGCCYGDTWDMVLQKEVLGPLLGDNTLMIVAKATLGTQCGRRRCLGKVSGVVVIVAMVCCYGVVAMVLLLFVLLL